jgi:tetratricopeptide (TPR) repeat protein
MRAADSTDFSVAVATIGIFGYELLGHDIIDLLGLTDSTIARHSEPPIKGMTTTWKERKHNTKYLLTRAPDYIVFSTGVKPSAPAERALLLFPEFLNSYRTVGWYYQPDPDYSGTIVSAFKKVRPVEGPLIPTYPVEYVQEYKKGLDAYVSGDHKKAIAHYAKALKVSPKPYNVYVIYQKAFSHLLSDDREPALNLLNMVLAQDSMVFEAHKDLYFLSAVPGDAARAAVHERWLKKLVPWYWPKINSDAMETRERILREQGR